MRNLRLPEYAAIAMFTLSAFLGMTVAYILVGVEAVYGQSSSGGNPSSGLGLIAYYLVAVVAMSAAIIYLSRRRGIGVLKYIFVAAMILIIYLVVSVVALVLPIYVSPFENYEYYGISFGIPLIFLYALLFRNHWLITNVAGLITSAGMEAFWGFEIGVFAALIFLSLFALYDYIAVYKTKHMLTLAKATAKSSIPLFFIIPSSMSYRFNNDINIDSGSDVQERKGDVLMLGFGDIALPNVLVVSAYLYGGPNWLIFSMLPLIGGIIGLIALFMFIKRPAPGLPLINAGVILGFALAYLIVNIL